MSENAFLDYAGLAKRWLCKESSLRNARPEDLPACLKRPGSRLVRFSMSEILAFERAHTAARDYEAERKLGLVRDLGQRYPRDKRVRS